MHPKFFFGERFPLKNSRIEPLGRAGGKHFEDENEDEEDSLAWCLIRRRIERFIYLVSGQ
jgi:hypothetical protein